MVSGSDSRGPALIVFGLLETQPGWWQDPLYDPLDGGNVHTGGLVVGWRWLDSELIVAASRFDSWSLYLILVTRSNLFPPLIQSWGHVALGTPLT